MYAREMASERIRDLVHEAEAHRLAKQTRRARREGARRVGARSIVSVLLWPVRH